MTNSITTVETYFINEKTNFSHIMYITQEYYGFLQYMKEKKYNNILKAFKFEYHFYKSFTTERN